MNSMIFTVPGKPFGKQRPRFARTGRAYTPDKTVVYENLIKTCFAEKYPNHIPVSGAIRVTIGAVFPIPQSWTKKKKNAAIAGTIRPKKPDWDNIGKIVCDALNGIAYADDSAIYCGQVEKRFGDIPALHVLIETEEVSE